MPRKKDLSGGGNIINAIEKYFQQEDILYEKIAEVIDKTPDYKVFINNREIVVEFKEFKSSKSDIPWRSGRVVTKTKPLGCQMIRDKIKTSSKQFRNYQNKPTMCILFNTGDAKIDLSSFAIRMAMFGDVFYSICVNPQNNQRLEEGFKYGRNAPSQIARKTDGSLISAVAVLEKIYPNQKSKRRLRIFHNPCAKIPLPKNIFTSEYNEEWIYEDKKGFKKL